MRSLLVSLALLSLAAPALSQTAPGEGGGRLSDTRPGAGSLGLRGAEAFAARAGRASSQAESQATSEDQGEAAPPAGLALRSLDPSLGPPPLVSLPAAPGPRQCRLQCAQDYYFCLAGDASDECPQAWGQCRLGCGPA